MSTKTIADVRDHLFKLLDQLSDGTKEPDYQRMRASCEVAQVMVNTVRVQVDYLRVVNGDGEMRFLDEPAEAPEPTEAAPASFVDPLVKGPGAEHPWRGQRVHRIGR
ncbi:hypothetical protein [Variovorax rhizosphaerae]|uniref:Uncharacterized protein n=1 Tax=Variovorax rhizosphaerae TaxID=1836200 RepID=A0ABU8WFV1_9BURK